MGIFKSATPVDFGQQAHLRRQSGHYVHAVIWEGAPSLAQGVGGLDALSDVIEAVEGAGWRLERTECVDRDGAGRAKLLLLFRAAE